MPDLSHLPPGDPLLMAIHIAGIVIAALIVLRLTSFLFVIAFLFAGASIARAQTPAPPDSDGATPLPAPPPRKPIGQMDFGPLVITDIAIVLFWILAIWLLPEMWRSPSKGTVLKFGLALACAFLSKFSSGLLLSPGCSRFLIVASRSDWPMGLSKFGSISNCSHCEAVAI